MKRRRPYRFSLLLGGRCSSAFALTWASSADVRSPRVWAIRAASSCAIALPALMIGYSRRGSAGGTITSRAAE